jgi:opacity protein-like surface antigen
MPVPNAWKGAASVLALAALTTAPLHAQGRVDVGLGVGAAIPTNNASDTYTLGYQGTVALTVHPFAFPVGLEFDANFVRLKLEDAGFGADVSDRILSGTVSLVHRFSADEEAKLLVYILGGVGAYNIKRVGPDAPIGLATNTDLGLNVGLGVHYDIGGPLLYLESRPNIIFAAGENLSYIPITLGVRLGGGRGRPTMIE